MTSSSSEEKKWQAILFTILSFTIVLLDRQNEQINVEQNDDEKLDFGIFVEKKSNTSRDGIQNSLAMDFHSELLKFNE